MPPSPALPLSQLGHHTDDSALAWRPTLWSLWRLLSDAPSTVAVLASRLRTSCRVVRGWLKDLQSCGAATRVGCGWCIKAGGGASRVDMRLLWEARARVELERDLWRAAVADESGVIGALVARVARHAVTPQSSDSSGRSDPTVPGTVCAASCAAVGL